MKSIQRLPIIVFIISLLFYNLYSRSAGKTTNMGDTMQIKSRNDFRAEVARIAGLADKQECDKALDRFWNYLKSNNKVPFVSDTFAAFVFRGEADSVMFQGDFSGWGRMGGGGTSAGKIGNTDLWILEKEFPSDARLDYKIVINGKTWILDPNNPNIQMSGFGPNSELRMPGWRPSPWTIRDNNLPAGSLSENFRIKSKFLGYDLFYRVYLPKNYDELKDLPVIYVTDGHEYADDEKGSMIIVLDNLIAKGKIKPVIAVFIDPRDPDSPSMNKRESQFLMNENFLNFVCDELVVSIDANYKTSKFSDDRAILGTSYGGVCATYFALMRSNVFHLVAIQSPAYGGASKLQDIYKGIPKLPLKIFMSAGTINDGEILTRSIKDKLEQDGYKLKYREVSEGHSWGNWRALLDDILIYFWEK